ncbi:MAG: 30S ribosomal protein S6 [Micrococcales bacterium]|nr:30S ribosomal protein S6 [Micrococcales bacterium]
MHKYEVLVILDSEVDEKTVGTQLDKFLNVIRNGGGTVDSVDIWGRRRFAYEINKKTEGIYAVVYLTCNPAEVLELDRQLKLSEAVVRTKVLRADNSVVVPEFTPGEDKPYRAKRSAVKAAE